MKNNDMIYIFMETLIFYKYIMLYGMMYGNIRMSIGDSMEIVKKIDNTIKVLKNNTSEDCIKKDKLDETEKEINKITKMMDEAEKKQKNIKKI